MKREVKKNIYLILKFLLIRVYLNAIACKKSPFL